MRLPIDTRQAIQTPVLLRRGRLGPARPTPPGSVVAQLTYTALSNTTAGAWPIARHLDEHLAP